MKRKILTTVFMTIFLVQPLLSLTSQELKVVAEQYVDFLNHAGKTNDPITLEEVSTIFADNLKKIEKGKTVLSSAKDLPTNWLTVRKKVGGWTVTLEKTIPSQEEQVVTIKITWTTAKDPKVLCMTMANLHLNVENKIELIDEVWAPCEGILAQ